MAWLTDDELLATGFRSLGKGVRISSSAKIYRPQNISIGNFSRIDDFATLSPGPDGFIVIGSYVHIAAYSMVESPSLVTLSDFSGLAARVSVYGSSDNYLGKHLTNPCVPFSMRNVDTSPIFFGRHVIIGASSVVLPGTHIGDGCAIGALSLVRGKLEPFGIYAGSPLKKRGERFKKLLDLEIKLLNSID